MSQAPPDKPGRLVATMPAYVRDMRSDGSALWLRFEDGSVWSLRPGLGDAVQVVSAQQAGAGFTLAIAPSEIYLTSNAGAIVAVAKSDGASRVLVSGEQQPSYLQTDGVALWWVVPGPLRVRSVSVAGGNASDATAVDSPFFAATADGVFFQLSGGVNNPWKLMQRAAGATSSTELDTVNAQTRIVASQGSLFYSSYSSVLSRPTAGGAARQLAAFTSGAANGPVAVGIDHLFLLGAFFFVDHGDPAQIPVLYRVPLSGGIPVVVATLPNVEMLATVGNVAYWCEGKSIYTPQP